MSAILTTCRRCGGQFMSGMVGTWMWPRHECPDGALGAPVVFNDSHVLDWSDLDEEDFQRTRHTET